MKIAVLMGGTSSEREVSLSSGLGVTRALRERGHDVAAIDTARGFIPREQEESLLPEGVHAEPPGETEAQLDLPKLGDIPEVHDADVAFLALHGGLGEDGTVQALLELLRIPYTGTGVLGSALAMDKDATKRLLRDAEIPTLPWRVARAPDFHYDADTIEDRVGYPLMVKPAKEGSSVGIHRVDDPAKLEETIRDVAQHDDEVMMECFAKGRELTVSILGDHALPPVEIRPKKGIYDYEAKYTPGMTEYLCPAPLDEELTALVQAYALRAFRVLKLRGYARVDFILSREEPYCLEANTLPGMTGTSLFPKAAKAAGIEYPELCERVIELALEQHRGRPR